MDTGWKTLAPETPGEHVNLRLTGGNIWGIRGSTFHRKSGYDMQKIFFFTKIKFINWYNYAATIEKKLRIPCKAW